MEPAWTNQLYFGDNLAILREHIPDESVDLIYLDPPFNSQATYNVLFAEKSGEKSAAQITAFEDTWHWGEESEHAFFDTLGSGPARSAKLLSALREFLGNTDLMAYLTMMAIRLIELHRALKPTGSIYLHCDPTASHYLKLIMDAVFSPRNFRNEIVWKRTAAHSAAKRWNDVHDIVLFYTKSDNYTWKQVLIDHSEAYTARYKHKNPDGKLWADDNLTGPGVRYGASGAEWRGFNPTSKGVHWKVSRKTVASLVGPEQAKKMSTIQKLDLLDEHEFIHWPQSRSAEGGGFPRFKRYLSVGVSIQDMVLDIPPINSQAQERLGYPTQKPLALLERIIQASSNEGDIILDPFCGCGTAIAAAERLHRRWIGIDITHLAIALMKHRLHGAFPTDLSPYDVIGVPKDRTSADALARQDRYQFEWWALGLVNARPAHDKRKGADHGVDGVLFFLDDTSGKPKSIVVQVKSGGVSVRDIRELETVRRREKAEIGVFITLHPPTRPMEQEAAGMGFYEPVFFPGHRFSKLQILTIAELLQGKDAQYPRVAPPVTFKRAQRQDKHREIQPKLF